MAIAKAVQGARHTGQTITWKRDDGSAQVLTGGTISARIINADDLKAVAFSSDGTFNITDGPNGVFTWGYGALDVAQAGNYRVQFKVTFTNYDLSYATDWKIEKAI